MRSVPSRHAGRASLQRANERECQGDGDGEQQYEEAEWPQEKSEVPVDGRGRRRCAAARFRRGAALQQRADARMSPFGSRGGSFRQIGAGSPKSLYFVRAWREQRRRVGQPLTAMSLCSDDPALAGDELEVRASPARGSRRRTCRSCPRPRDTRSGWGRPWRNRRERPRRRLRPCPRRPRRDRAARGASPRPVAVERLELLCEIRHLGVPGVEEEHEMRAGAGTESNRPAVASRQRHPVVRAGEHRLGQRRRAAAAPDAREARERCSARSRTRAGRRSSTPSASGRAATRGRACRSRRSPACGRSRRS